MSQILHKYIKHIIAAAGLACAFWIISYSTPSAVTAQSEPSDYLNFESPQVHPLALTPDRTRLLAVNSPAGSLVVFDLTGELPRVVDEIPVGLEPVSVTARNDREAWVANWLSDSVSVVDLTTGNVVRTIDVGDEPTDVVFAGNDAAFVCVSGLAQVKVYDPDAPAGVPHVIDIKGKQPRSLARDSSGERVFVTVFESGNQTTIVPTDKVARGGGLPKPSPKKAKNLPAAPEVGLIVRWNGSRWADEKGNTKWNQFVPYTLSDIDLVVIDARGEAPGIASEVRGIGTHLGNAAFDPAADRLYIANTESHNQIRFEPKLKGRFQSNRVSVVNLGPGGRAVTAVDLNPHIDFAAPAGSAGERRLSLALPSDIARAGDGTLYVAAASSGKVGVLNSSGAVQERIVVGAGPSGLALEEGSRRLYVLNRFDQSLSVVNTATRRQIAQLPIGFNPEPQEVREGRLFLYDAGLSAHGDLSCASCHLNGHRDGLAWDLGDPKGAVERGGGIIPFNFHPMKGPMTTQSLRGIVGNGPMHWRGDRDRLSAFNPAFVSLLGGPRQLTGEEMARFEAFVRTLTYPPNPLQNLDRTYPNPSTGPSAARGEDIFANSRLDAGLLTCNQCHSAVPGFKSGTNELIIPGPLLRESQDFKVPQLRGMYQKTGLRAVSGEQLSGFGFLHDGSVDTLLSFLRLPIFTFANDDDRRDVEAFLLAFDSGIAPAVGLQATLSGDNKTSPAAGERISLLMQQADAGNSDLIVKGIYQGARRGFTYVGNGRFQPDKIGEATVSWQELVQAADLGAELTFTGVPVGSGQRRGIDADSDGTLDGDS